MLDHMTSRKFFKTIVKVTVLSEEPIHEMELNELHYAITEGGMSGEVEYGFQNKLNGKQAAMELLAQGSDPSFFRLTEDGEDIEP